MKSPFSDVEAVLRALLQAYRGREAVEATDGWQAEVMRRVRNIGPLQPMPDRLMLFTQLVWRLAPAACLLVIVTGALLLKFDFASGSNLLTSFFSDTTEITLAQLFPF